MKYEMNSMIGSMELQGKSKTLECAFSSQSVLAFQIQPVITV